MTELQQAVASVLQRAHAPPMTEADTGARGEVGALSEDDGSSPRVVNSESSASSPSDAAAALAVLISSGTSNGGTRPSSDRELNVSASSTGSGSPGPVSGMGMITTPVVHRGGASPQYPPGPLVSSSSLRHTPVLLASGRNASHDGAARASLHGIALAPSAPSQRQRQRQGQAEDVAGSCNEVPPEGDDSEPLSLAHDPLLQLPPPVCFIPCDGCCRDPGCRVCVRLGCLGWLQCRCCGPPPVSAPSRLSMCCERWVFMASCGLLVASASASALLIIQKDLGFALGLAAVGIIPRVFMLLCTTVVLLRGRWW